MIGVKCIFTFFHPSARIFLLSPPFLYGSFLSSPGNGQFVFIPVVVQQRFAPSQPSLAPSATHSPSPSRRGLSRAHIRARRGEGRVEAMQHSPVMEARKGPHGLWQKSTTAGQPNGEDLSRKGDCASAADLHLHSLLVAHHDIKEGKGRMTFRDICNVCQNRLLNAKDWRRRMSKRMNSGQGGWKWDQIS